MAELNNPADIDVNEPVTRPRNSWVWVILLFGILLVAAYFRFVGLNWDQGQHLHPDERFLTMVSQAINPPNSLAQYFNTAVSPLNPHNQGYGFYVYGDLPIFMVRYLAGVLNQTGYDQIYLVGRAVSAFLDLLTIILIYLLADQLFRNKRLALLAAAFDTLAVLQIQLSHYYTVDVPANFFIFLAFYIAICIQTDLRAPSAKPGEEEQPSFWKRFISDWRTALPYGLFGIAAGMALASKISAAPLVFLLPLGAWVWWDRLSPEDRSRTWPAVLRNLAIGGFLCLLAFRIFQPYAFSGPGFFGFSPDPKWLQNMQEIQAQTNGDVDAPFALQWIRRPITFAWTNMVDWGFGLPLGLLAWAGFLWMAWRMIRGEWRKFLLLWGWTAGFFTWQSLQGNPSMRYQIPVYPTLAIMAAWVVFQLWEARPAWIGRLGRIPWQKVTAVAVGGIALVGAFAWALAFSQIYMHPVTRVDATSWIYQNVPGPVNLHVQTTSGIQNQPLSYPYDTSIKAGQPYSTIFTVPNSGVLTELDLPQISFNQSGPDPVELELDLTDVNQGNKLLSSGRIQISASNSQDKPYKILLNDVIPVVPNHFYGLSLQLVGNLGTVSLSAPVQFILFSQYAQQAVTLPPQVLEPGVSVDSRFVAKTSGQLASIQLPLDMSGQAPPFNLSLGLSIFDQSDQGNVIGTTSANISAATELNSVTFMFDPPVSLVSQHLYSLVLEQTVPGSTARTGSALQARLMGDPTNLIMPYPVQLIHMGNPYLDNFTAQYTGSLGEIFFPYILDQNIATGGNDSLVVSLVDGKNHDIVLAQGHLEQVFRSNTDPRGPSATLKFDQPAQIEKGADYYLRFELQTPGLLALRGSSPANESTWDDGLPLRMNGYDGYSGLYQRDLNFEMYWDDNAAKLTRLEDTLNQSDYIFITSNRQWGTIPRVQERYPLSTAYYRDLLGCPPEKDILWCYSVAEPGMFSSKLGFDLVKVAESYPALGTLKINDVLAEEAFTVYDHPKVLIFKKTAGYTPQIVNGLLSKVDLTTEIRVTPKKAPSYPANLMLPDNRLAQQQAGGTWTDLFNRLALINESPIFSAIFWYLAIALLGLVVYPFVHLALGRLPDHGYPLAKVTGMVLLAYLVWVAGASGISFTQGAIWATFGILIVFNAVLAYLQRVELKAEWKHNRRYFVTIELITLAFFAIDLAIRLGNPDLWHPAKGGEKPMDFSYLNAVLKSTSFPPYDPWFAGGFINYYYYGFVLIGTLIKGLGIVPSVAYNLALPSLFSMVAMGAFSIGWNLFGGKDNKQEAEMDLSSGEIVGEPELVLDGETQSERRSPLPIKPLVAGLSASVAMLILGNLGTVKMIWEGFQRLVVSPDVMDKADIFSRMAWTVQGLFKFIGGQNLPYGAGEWYWNPSRAIPGYPITEFPFFTFLYGDPHAHMIALPVTLLALAWALSIIKGRWQWGSGKWNAALKFSASFLLGGLAIGALRPTNTWDMPAYLGLGIVAVLYAAIRNGQISNEFLSFLAPVWKRIAIAVASAALLVGLAFLLYQPYSQWYAMGYNQIEVFNGDRTPMWAYTMHWGVFLFVIFSWFVFETLDWLSTTPVSALNRLRPYRGAILGFGLAYLAAAIGISLQVPIAWMPMALALWALILIFRPKQSDPKRFVLTMTGLALVLTFAVEVIVLKGDIDRMNTVFKFYLQAWTLLSISAAASFWWLLPHLEIFLSFGWRRAWITASAILVFGAALFPVFATSDKVHDRMSVIAPHTLDGMTYMATSTYSSQNVDMDLSQDYRAILWMQQNVKGSPVIVEGHTTEYLWGTRFTIYTGLPGVVGWNYHQQQQRGSVVSGDWITGRISDIENFYLTTDLESARHFLDSYNVHYIILGQLENAYYPGPGLQKFAAQNGKMWKEVYHDQNTFIYEVIE